MTVVKPDNARKILFTTLILVLSGFACSIQAPTTDQQRALEPTQRVLSIKITTPRSPVTTLTTPTTVAEVTAIQSLNVRERAGENNRVIGALYHGDTVTLTGKCSEDPKGWTEIVWTNGAAWVNADFLSKNKCSEE